MISLDVCLHPHATAPAHVQMVRLAGISYTAVIPSDTDRQKTAPSFGWETAGSSKQLSFSKSSAQAPSWTKENSTASHKPEARAK